MFQLARRCDVNSFVSCKWIFDGFGVFVFGDGSENRVNILEQLCVNISEHFCYTFLRCFSAPKNPRNFHAPFRKHHAISTQYPLQVSEIFTRYSQHVHCCFRYRILTRILECEHDVNLPIYGLPNVTLRFVNGAMRVTTA